MTDDPTPTTARRQLGAQLRELRQARGLTAAEVADALSFSVSKVSRLESGDRAVSEPDLEALLAYFEVSDDRARDLAASARSGRRRRGRATHVPVQDGDFHQVVQSGFVELERDADRVREFNSGLVPGLLQTEDYMRAMMIAAAPGDPDTLDRAVALRLERQRRLASPGRYEVIVDEAVLAREVGNAGIMRGQLDAMARLAASGAANVRVIPFSAGFHPGLNSVFVALSMARTGAPDVVFIEGLVGFQKFDRPDDVERFDRIWNELSECSMSTPRSMQLVAKYLLRYSEGHAGSELR